MSILGLSKWKPRHLLAAWSAYWAALVLVTLGPAAIAMLKVTVPEGAKGSISANFGDAGLQLIVKSGEATTWFGQASVVSVVAWLAAPPLLLWLAWLATRPKRRSDISAEIHQGLLGDAPMRPYDREKQPDPQRVDRN